MKGDVLISGDGSTDQQNVAQIVSDLQGDEAVKSLTVTTTDRKLPDAVGWKVEGEFEFYAS